MCTDTTRAQHARKGPGLPSDLTDAEWALLEPFLPPASPFGRPREWPMRQIVDAMLYLLRGGLPWRMLPPGFPPATTVQRYFYAWRDRGVWPTINHYLLMAVRESEGRKRHILTDTCGYLVHAVVHGADIQDRDGAPLVMAGIVARFPWLRHVFADGGYAGEKLRAALDKIGKWTLEIIKQSDAAKGFKLLPRRWVVERTFAWLNRNRRLAKDFENSIESATAWLFMASVQLINRKLARPCN